MSGFNFKVNRVLKFIIGELARIISDNPKHVYTSRQSLEQWISQVKKNPPKISGKVLITAIRNETWIEWGAYSAAVFRLMGFESTILYKGSEVRKHYKEKSYFNFWSGVSKIPGVTLVDIELLPFDKSRYNLYYEQCTKSAVAALAYDYHIESSDITDNYQVYFADLEFLKVESAQNGARIYQHLIENKYHQFICYSGIIRDTNMILQAALDANQETVCVEGWAWRAGHLIYNFNAPALEYNVQGWLKHFGAWTDQKEKEINQYFNFLDGNRQENNWLENFYMVQRAKVNKEFPERIEKFLSGNHKIFLLPCNVIGDSSLLNRETIFKSHREFVKQTIIFFANRPDLKLIVRAHPAEEWVKEKVAIKMGLFAKELAVGHSNILVIDSGEILNTFSLIPFVHTGLVWVTSAGVDMVARGIPVITAAKPKYTGMGIVEEPETIEAFFDLINKFASNDLRPSIEQMQKAKEYLYLVFKGFSYKAQGQSYRALSCKLGNMPDQEEHDMFYKILLKLEKAPDLY
jgi:hypothetical protein